METGLQRLCALLRLTFQTIFLELLTYTFNQPYFKTIQHLQSSQVPSSTSSITMNLSKTTFTPRKISKRVLTDQSSGEMNKSPRVTSSQRSPGHSTNQVDQSKTITLQQVKALGSTAYANNLRFQAKALIVQPRQQIMDPRVQYHRQRILFADATKFLTAYMFSDLDEDPSNPKIAPNLTNGVTNFRVVKKGDILLHDKTSTDM